MYEGVEVVGGHDEAVALGHITPTPHQQVPTQTVLEGARQVLVEDRVEVVVISAWYMVDRDDKCFKTYLNISSSSKSFISLCNHVTWCIVIFDAPSSPNTLTYMHACVRAYVRTYVRTYVHTYIQQSFRSNI